MNLETNKQNTSSFFFIWSPEAL